MREARSRNVAGHRPFRSARALFGATIFLLGFNIAAWASSPLRSEVDSAFTAGQYERVELLVLRAGPLLPELAVEDRVTINLTAGFAMIMLERENDAREYFRRALDADPTVRLDPIRISPKFRVIFDEVKGTYRAQDRIHSNPPHQVILMAGPRTRSVLTNLVVPGSGHWLEGNRWRGAIVFGTQLLAAGVFAWRLDEFHRSQDAYIAEQDRSRVSSAYDKYYDDYRTVWISGIAMGAVYVAAQADLALFRKPQPDDAKAFGSLEVIPCPGGARASLKICW
ncbi:hypothetical protein KKH27_02205 [bacterium]|nr:hypothetical protein [bacterium]MBU1984246.1 hypothetical protein [bacterium]